MLEQKKKDTHTGFSELAESNKELKSFKSGDLHRGISRGSGRPMINVDTKIAYVSASHTEETNSGQAQPSFV